MDSVPKDLLQGLLNELECPVCMDYMVSEIKQCKKGHNICKKCRPQLSSCPVCRGNITGTRNISLEKLALQLTYPCRYRKQGCNEKCSPGLMDDHVKDCPFGFYASCPISVEGQACPWKDQLPLMKEHLIKKHVSETREVTGQFKYEIRSGSVNKLYSEIIFVLGQIFQLNIIATSASDICEIYGFVKYIGPKKHATKYKYEISLVKESGPGRVTACHLTHSYEKTVDDMNGGICFTYDNDLARQYFRSKEGGVTFIIEISKVN